MADPAGRRAQSLEEQLLIEALGRLAVPAVAERILLDGLMRAGIDEVPRDSIAFSTFAAGPLREAVEEVLGGDAADAVLTDLGPVFAVAAESPVDSGIRIRRRSAPAPPQPLAVLATRDRRIGDQVASRLNERAEIVFADDTFGLLQAAQRHDGRPILVAVHDELPALRHSTLETLAELLPKRATVVQWGRLQLDAPENGGDWFALGPVDDADAIADVCLALLPKPMSKRVLLADGDDARRASCARVLSAAGYEVIESTDGIEALETATEKSPHAIALADDLPGLGGAELAILLRGRLRERLPPIVLMNDLGLGRAGPGVAAIAAANGEELAEAIEDLLD